MTYNYLIYGLHVQSFIEIPEAFVDENIPETPDVIVEEGTLPQEMLNNNQDKTDSDYFCALSRIGIAFRIPDVADYVSTADKITVRPIADPTTQPVKTFLLGSAFGYCMILRKKVVLHGGAVSKNNLGIIVTGESGAGKSTVTNALRAEGYSFIADDVCGLSDNGDLMHIDMAYPQQKLCRDAALRMGYSLSELIFIDEDRDKYAVRLKDNYLPGGMDFHFLFEIVLSEGDELCFKRIQGHEALMLLLRNIYRGEGSFESWGMPTDYMKQCLKLAQTVEIYQISRPQNLNTLPDIVNFIESKISEKSGV